MAIKVNRAKGVITSHGNFFRICILLPPDAGVDQHAQQVDKQVNEHKEHDEGQQDRLHRDEIAEPDRLDEERADAV